MNRFPIAAKSLKRDQMNKRDYYEVLGLDQDAKQDDIKKAYRSMAMKYHPDRNPDDAQAEERFKEVGEAYSVLSDGNKRARYDRFGHTAPGMTGTQDFGGFSFGMNGVDPFELFRSVFGGFGGDIFGRQTGARHQRIRRGTDLKVDLTLTLEEIAESTTKKVKVKILKPCRACSGTGSKSGKLETCPRCNGSGETQQVNESFFGRVVNITICNLCGGEGKILRDACEVCSGDGLERGEKTFDIKVPAGVSEGNYLRMKGEGNAAVRGGRKGDVIIAFHEKSHDLFTRHGDDVLCEMQISYSDAVLGAEIEVPTLSGKVRLKINPSTPTGKMFRLRNKGITHLNSNRRGDQLVRVTIYVPSKISTEERNLLEELRGFSPKEMSGNSKPFFKKVRDIFN